MDHLILPNLAAAWQVVEGCVLYEVPQNQWTNRTMLDSARDLFSRSAISDVDYEAGQCVSWLGMSSDCL